MRTDEVEQGQKRAESSPVVHAIAIIILILHVNPDGNSANAQSAGCETDILRADDGEERDVFGWSTSIAGDYAFFGAPHGAYSGSVYVFKRDESGWTQNTELNASDPGRWEDFGHSVSADGDFVLVGARKGDAGATERTGAAYVYRLRGEYWVEESKLTAHDAAEDDSFGYSVSLSGDWAVVGAPADDDYGDRTGAIYFFHRDGQANWVQRAKILASEGEEDDRFGVSAAMADDWAIAGAPNSDVSCPSDMPECNSGAAYIFHRIPNSTMWEETTKIVGNDTGARYGFGREVAIDGEVAVVSAPNHPGPVAQTGTIYVFRYNGSEWVQEAKLFASDGVSDDQFGYSVAVSGDNVVVGAHNADSPFDDSGTVYWFQYDGQEWVERGKLVANYDSAEDWFGWSVGINDELVTVGAYQDAYGTGVGYVYTIGPGIDCNDNGSSDQCDVTDGTSEDTNGNGIPDECDCPGARCNDGLFCTLDRCIPNTTLCEHVVLEGWCAASNPNTGQMWCIQHGTPNPFSECSECNATVNQKDWSPVAEGTPCTADGLFCTGDETCRAGRCESNGDPCAANGQVCSESTQACFDCSSDSQCDDRLECTINICNDASVCEHPYSPPDTPCGDPTETVCNHADTCDGFGSCNPNIEPGGSACDDGLFCTTGQCDPSNNQCTRTLKEGFCLIDDICHYDGEQHPENICWKCSPETDQSSWSVSRDGMPSEIVYVDEHASEPGCGWTWCEAFASLADALVLTQPDTEIRVAEGTYTPDPAGLEDPREATFQLRSGVEIYGGYAGCGAPNADERDVNRYETVLTGDLLGNDEPYVPSSSTCCSASLGEGCDNEACEKELAKGYAHCAENWTSICTYWASILCCDLCRPTRCDNSLHVVTGSGTDSTSVLDGFTITGGNANYPDPNDDGAGVYNNGGSPVFVNCVFSENLASDNGGAMLNDDHSAPALKNCTFSENRAGDDGGGIRNHLSDPTFDGCTFVGNIGRWGGAISSAHSTLTLTDCTLSGGQASYGGAIFNEYGSAATLTDCTLSGNSVRVDGGALYASSGGLTLTNCLFVGNSAERYAGGLSTRSVSATLTNCRFLRNSSGYYGGAVRNWTSYLALANCIFSGNSAANGGGAIVNEGHVLTLTGCTFSDNSAGDDGGAIYSPNDRPVLTNCILWGDRPNELSGDRSSRVSVSYSNVEGGTGEPWFGETCIDADPLFVDPEGADGIIGTVDDDFRLLHGSPCINAGDPAFVADVSDTDLDGHPRLVGCRVDIGAYEQSDCQEWGDFDGDHDVDLRDVSGFQLCVNAAASRPEWVDACSCMFDDDGDGQIDLHDFESFERGLRGPR